MLRNKLKQMTARVNDNDCDSDHHENFDKDEDIADDDNDNSDSGDLEISDILCTTKSGRTCRTWRGTISLLLILHVT